MDDYLDLCASNPLFHKIAASDLKSLLSCLHAKKKTFEKGTTLFYTGDRAEYLGIVLSGTIRTESSDILGNRNIIAYMEPGQLFCDAYSSTADQVLMVDVVAHSDSTVLLIRTGQLLHLCSETQHYRDQLLENLIRILSQKYVDLGCKVIHLSGRSTRKKLLSYLSEQFRFSGGKPFSVPFNRQELADYLFIERSGLSTEWNRLKKEGILIVKNGMCSLSIPDPS